MPKTPITKALCFAALLTLAGAAVPAQASHDDWFLPGGAFRVGHLSFSILLGDPGGGYPYGYYYRTSDRLAYHGLHCSSACLLRDGYAYHHESCPLVLHHLEHYRFDPFDLHYRYAPPHPVWFSHRYDRRLPYQWHHHNRFDYKDRYDRRDRYDRDYGRHDRDHDRYDRDHDRRRDRGRYDRDDHRRDRDRGRDRGRHRGDRDHRHPRRHPGRN